MCKFIFALFIVLLSICSLPTMAANCSGGSIIFQPDPTDAGYWRTRYTSGSPGPMLVMMATVQNDMTCEPDALDDGGWHVSNINIQLINGTCKNSSTVSTPYPGIEWKLQDMSCDANWITSNTTKSVGSWDQRTTWPSGTYLGKAMLVVNGEYWMQNTQTGVYYINIPFMSYGSTLLRSPSIPVASNLGLVTPFQLLDTATCSMGLSTENLDFGKLTPINVNDGSLYKEFGVSYSCKNKAAANGLYVRFDPENVVDAANGIFSANDNNGRKLNFKITRPFGSEQIIPLNANYQIYPKTDSDIDNTATFRIRVMPSTPFPTGKVSTYLNVSLIYR